MLSNLMLLISGGFIRALDKCKQMGQQTNKQASTQTKQAVKQSSNQAIKQASLRASLGRSGRPRVCRRGPSVVRAFRLGFFRVRFVVVHARLRRLQRRCVVWVVLWASFSCVFLSLTHCLNTSNPPSSHVLPTVLTPISCFYGFVVSCLKFSVFLPSS